MAYRMAAAKYEWRIPEEDEVNQEIELPQPLREAMAAMAAAAATGAQGSAPVTTAGMEGLPPQTSSLASSPERQGGAALMRQPSAGAMMGDPKGDTPSAPTSEAPKLYPPEQVSRPFVPLLGCMPYKGKSGPRDT